MTTLDTITTPITDEMRDYRTVFEECLHSDNALLNEVLAFITQRKGKMMRPMLTILSAKLLGEVGEATLCTAAAFELFHTASLVHDDVVDESDERRGMASTRGAFGNKAAVLVGDYILSLALQLAAKSGNARLVSILSVAAQNLSSGELLQLKSVHNQEISEEVYFKIIKEKTAALFSACGEAGALTATTDEAAIATMKAFGETIGICFQIRDDIFDYNNDTNIGKPTGNDMQEGKLTLPVIYALHSTGNEEMLTLARKVKNHSASADDVARLVSFTKENGGIEYAEKVMLEYADRAKALIANYPDNDIKTALLAYADYVVGRKI